MGFVVSSMVVWFCCVLRVPDMVAVLLLVSGFWLWLCVVGDVMV